MYIDNFKLLIILWKYDLQKYSMICNGFWWTWTFLKFYSDKNEIFERTKKLIVAAKDIIRAGKLAKVT